jgi:hypothetical protein
MSSLRHAAGGRRDAVPSPDTPTNLVKLEAAVEGLRSAT